jgi:probable phosphoglycerate mutase
MTRVVWQSGADRLAELARTAPLPVVPPSFLFLRHGETDGNLKGHYQREDQPLNATGEAQAAAAARILAGEAIGEIVASPMARAWRTASLAAEPHALAPQPEHRIRERVFAALFGQPNHDFDWAKDPPGCETLHDFVTRVRSGLADALATEAPPGRERLVVAHGGVLLVLTALLDIDLHADLHRNATPLRFRRNGAGWRAERLGPDAAS